MTSVRERTVFSDGRFTVTAVESLEFRADRTDRHRLVTGSLRPVVVIVREPDRSYALDMDAQPVDIDKIDLPSEVE